MDSITKQKQKSLDTMADELVSFLEQIGFHPYHIRKYRRHVERIRHFMNEQESTTPPMKAKYLSDKLLGAMNTKT